jgi:5-methylthioadenosine/S-adenosylhomocysteine deaminase
VRTPQFRPLSASPLSAGVPADAAPADKARADKADDLLILAEAVVTLDAEWKIHAPGYLAVRDGRISAAGPAAEARDRKALRRIDAGRSLVMPGFVNTHTHIPMAAFRGACEDAPDRLTRYIFPMEKRLVTPELTYWSSLFCLCEMARSGTTTFADMYYFEDEVAAATELAGMRAILGETLVDQGSPDARDFPGGMAYAKDFIEAWKGHPLIRPCLAPHAPYTVDAEHLAEIAVQAEALDVDIMMHAAEMDFENERFSAAGGSVLRYLDGVEGLLSGRLLAVHMLFVDDGDISLAARRGLRVAHCPASNAKSGRPICPAWRMQKAGIPLGLGTDGPLSGNGMDMEGVLNLFPKLQKVRERNRAILPAREALRAATLGGAEALGLDKEIGSLEAGKKADFIIADLDDFNMRPVYDWHSTIVYAMRPHNVRSVFVDGRAVVEEGRMKGFDEDEVMDRMEGLREASSSYIEELSRS